jgi:hypothetical protein
VPGRREWRFPSDTRGRLFVRRLYSVNPNTIVVLVANFPYALPWAAENATTILHLTHASQELGTALGDVLFGDVNPGGKTTQTWPKSLDQLPPMMDYDIRHGRTYMYFAGEPQYPFGHGLSYTTFSLARIATSAASLGLGGEVTVSLDVANTGARDAPGPGPRLLGHDAPRLDAREGEGGAPRRQLLGRLRPDAAHDDRRWAIGGSPWRTATRFA